MTSNITVRPRVATVLLLALALCLVSLANGAPSRASNTVGVSDRVARTWGTDGTVYAVLPVGQYVIIGGSFTKVVGPNGEVQPATYLAKFDTLTGRFDPSWSVSLDGEVSTLAASGGALYVGGAFKNVNGSAQKFVAAVSLSTGERMASFRAQTDRAVSALQVIGGQLYIGGRMQQVKDATGVHLQPYAARVDATTGQLDTGWAPALNAAAYAFEPAADGQSVYVGGDFTTVAGFGWATRLARLSLVTAQPDPAFVAGPTNQAARAPVRTIVRSGGQLLVAVTGSGGACALLDATNGSVQWSKHGNGDMVAAVFFGPYAYCGGHFSGTDSFDGLTRNKLAAVEVATGTTTSFAPLVNSALGVFAMGAGPDALYIGGDFTKVGTVDAPQFGMFRALDAVLAPTVPSGLTADAGDAGVQLAWAQPSSDGGSALLPYRVYRSSGGGPAVVVGQSASAGFNDTSVTNGVDYTYTVTARSSAGESPMSAPVTAQPMSGQVVVPAAPASFAAVGGVEASNLTWTLPPNDGGAPITAYRVYRGTTPGGEMAYRDVSAPAATFSDTDVSIGSRYYYKVSAINAVGEGAWSAESSAVPNSGVPSPPALSLTATSAGSVSLAWTVPTYSGSPVTKYVLVRDGVKVATPAPGVTSYTDSTAVTGQTYVYQVRALNSYGTSKWSNSVTVAVP